MKKIMSILVITSVLLLTSCNRPSTVPVDCVGDECEADFCELNPDDLSCKDPVDPIEIDVDQLFEDATNNIDGAVSYTETSTYTYTSGDIDYQNTLISKYEKVGNYGKYYFESTTQNDYGSWEKYFIINQEETSFDLYYSNDGEYYYANSDIPMQDVEEPTIAFSEEYTVEEQTIKTRDYYVFTTTFEDFESIKTLVESYYPFNYFRELPINVLQQDYKDIEIKIYIDKDKQELSILEIYFEDVVNTFYTKINETLVDELSIVIEYSDFDTTSVSLPDDFEEINYLLDLGVYYENITSVYDIYSIDYHIDQILESPLGNELLILDKESEALHILNYQTMEDDIYTFDYKPMTIYIKDDLLFVGLQIRKSLSEEFETLNGRIEVYDLNTMEKINSIDVKYDPYDLVVTNYGQVIVSPATGQHGMMMVYDLDGNFIYQFDISEQMNLYLDEANNRVYQYAYWDGVRRVVDLTEDGQYEKSYRPDHDIDSWTIEPKELYFAPDGSLIVTPRGSLHLALNDVDLDGTLITYIPFNPNHVTFDDTDMYVSEEKGVALVDLETLTYKLLSTPIESIFSALTYNGMVTINQTESGEFYLMNHKTDQICTDSNTESSCNDFTVKELTYNPEELSLEEIEILHLTLDEVSMYPSVTTIQTLKEIGPNAYELTFNTTNENEKLIVLLITDEEQNVLDTRTAFVNINPTFNESDLIDLMHRIISEETSCQYFVGASYYTCLTSDVAPYQLFDVYHISIEGNTISYTATKNEYYHMSVYYTGEVVEENGVLKFKQIQVIDNSLRDGIEFPLQELFWEIVEQFEQGMDANSICSGNFANQEQEDLCIDMFSSREGLRLYPDFEWDYESTGHNAFIFGFENGFEYVYLVEGILGEEYDILIDWTLESFVDPSAEITAETVGNLLRNFHNGYYQPSIDDYCEIHISNTNQELRDACYEKNVKRFRARDIMMEIYDVIDLGNQTFEVYTRHTSSTSDYYEIAIVHMAFEDSLWKFDSYEWTPYLDISVQEAVDTIDLIFDEFASYNDYEYCYNKLGITFNQIPDQCRIDLYLERIEGIRYSIIDISHIENSKFAVIYKESPNTTIIYESEFVFYEFLNDGSTSYFETVLSETDATVTDGSLLSRIETLYTSYFNDLLDNSITDEILYNTYINTQYNSDSFNLSRANTLNTYKSIEVTNVDFKVDYRYQIYYEIYFTTIDNNDFAETHIAKVKIDQSDTLKLAPVFDVTYTITLEQATLFVEDLIDASIIMYFEPFSCSDYISSTSAITCQDDNQASILLASDWPRDFIVEDLGNNQFQVSYIYDFEGTIGTVLTYTLILEEGSIKLVSIE